MPFQLTVADNKPYLWLITTGSIASFDELLQYGRRVLSFVKEYGAKYLLLDERNRTEDLHAADIADYADTMCQESLQNAGLRVAMLVRGAGPKDEDFDLILQNRIVLDYKRFTDAEAAESWLLTHSGPNKGHG